MLRVSLFQHHEVVCDSFLVVYLSIISFLDGTCSEVTPLIALSQSPVVRRPLNTVLSRYTKGSLQTRRCGRSLETSARHRAPFKAPFHNSFGSF